MQNEHTEQDGPASGSVFNDFLGAFLAYLLLETIATCAFTALMLLWWRDLNTLSSLVGTSNPITLGALLTGFVALVGFNFLIMQDDGLLFGWKEGTDLQKLIALILMSAGIINLTWELLRSILNGFDTQVRKIQSKTGGPTVEVESTTPGTWTASWVNTDGTEVDETVLTISESFRNMLAPNYVGLALVTAAAIAFAYTVGNSTRPMPRGARARLEYLSAKIEATENLAANLRELRSHSRLPLYSSRRIRTRYWLQAIMQPIIVISLVWLLSTWSGLSENDRSLMIVSYFGVWLTTTWAFLIHKRYVISAGQLTDRATAIYGLACSFLIFVAILAVDVKLSFPAAVLTTLWGLFVSAWHTQLIRKIK